MLTPRPEFQLHTTCHDQVVSSSGTGGTKTSVKSAFPRYFLVQLKSVPVDLACVTTRRRPDAAVGNFVMLLLGEMPQAGLGLSLHEHVTLSRTKWMYTFFQEVMSCSAQARPFLFSRSVPSPVIGIYHRCAQNPSVHVVHAPELTTTSSGMPPPTPPLPQHSAVQPCTASSHC